MEIIGSGICSNLLGSKFVGAVKKEEWIAEMELKNKIEEIIRLLTECGIKIKMLCFDEFKAFESCYRVLLDVTKIFKNHDFRFGLYAYWYCEKFFVLCFCR